MRANKREVFTWGEVDLSKATFWSVFGNMQMKNLPNLRTNSTWIAFSSTDVLLIYSLACSGLVVELQVWFSRATDNTRGFNWPTANRYLVPDESESS